MQDVNNVSPGANGGRINLQAAPGGDLNWDELFPNPELAAQQPQVANPGTNPQSQPQASQNQPFLKAGETVYNTAEDAINGTVHKDKLIDNYRRFLNERGIDPNTLQENRPQVQSQAEPQRGPSPYKYYGNPEFFEEVASAAASRDKVKYEKLMSAHSREAAQAAFQEMIDPWRSTLAETNRNKAIRQVSADIPDFQKFLEGPGYKRVVDSIPLFKEMVQIGENDPVAAQRLPEVYRSMYLTYQGLNQAQAQPATAVTQNTPTVRTQQSTLQPSALTPPAPSPNTGNWAETNWRGNKSLGNESRKQLIEDGNHKFNNMRFDDVGL